MEEVEIKLIPCLRVTKLKKLLGLNGYVDCVECGNDHKIN
ncbi:unnamed protein product, partial [Brachionus calyciflorus]